jgi:predicted dehydrogenase
LERAVEAYDLLSSGEPSLGIVLEYPGVGLGEVSRTVALGAAKVPFDSAQGTLSQCESGRTTHGPGEGAPIGLTSPRPVLSGAEAGLGSYDQTPALGGVEGSVLSPSTSLRTNGAEGRVLSGVEAARSVSGGRCVASFIGSGNYATAVLIPAFKATGAALHCVASSGGVSGVHAGRKFGFAETTTDTDRVFEDGAANTVVISTRHDSHARLVMRALRAGKHVFVEKPLCLTLAELGEIEAVLGVASPSPQPSPVEGEGVEGRALGPSTPLRARKGEAPVRTREGEAPVRTSEGEARVLSGVEAGVGLLMVGFNRRFSPLVVKMKSLLSGLSAPKAMVMTVNAGAIPADHWTQDPAVGGGRIVGEACHFIDLLRHLAGAPIVSHSRLAMDSATGDTVSLQLAFADGSIGTIHYLANGNKAFPKERLEIFCGGRILQLDNFRRLSAFGWPGFRKMNLWRMDKGQTACSMAFVQAVEQGGPAPIPLQEIFEVSRVTIALARI